jgi:hypothetical protein
MPRNGASSATGIRHPQALRPSSASRYRSRMSEPPDTKNEQKARREARRAAALRENLKRRKTQARGRIQSDQVQSDRVQADGTQPATGSPGGKTGGEGGNRA